MNGKSVFALFPIVVLCVATAPVHAQTGASSPNGGAAGGAAQRNPGDTGRLPGGPGGGRFGGGRPGDVRPAGTSGSGASTSRHAEAHARGTRQDQCQPRAVHREQHRAREGSAQEIRVAHPGADAWRESLHPSHARHPRHAACWLRRNRQERRFRLDVHRGFNHRYLLGPPTAIRSAIRGARAPWPSISATRKSRTSAWRAIPPKECSGASKMAKARATNPRPSC